jgi:hypothetical protein
MKAWGEDRNFPAKGKVETGGEAEMLCLTAFIPETGADPQNLSPERPFAGCGERGFFGFYRA